MTTSMSDEQERHDRAMKRNGIDELHVYRVRDCSPGKVEKMGNKKFYRVCIETVSIYHTHLKAFTTNKTCLRIDGKRWKTNIQEFPWTTVLKYCWPILHHVKMS